MVNKNNQKLDLKHWDHNMDVLPVFVNLLLNLYYFHEIFLLNYIFLLRHYLVFEMHIFHYILNHSLILLLHILDLSYNLHMDILFLHKINNEMYLLNHIMILGFDLFSFLYMIVLNLRNMVNLYSF